MKVMMVLDPDSVAQPVESVALAKSKKKKLKVRKQSGCIPYRDVDGVRQVLLVKKLKKGAWWGFTKGGAEPHLDNRANAAKECWEEAGVTGTVTKKIGKFEYEKDNMEQRVVMYAMEFHQEFDSWQEKKFRKRKWFTLPEARDKLSREHHKLLDEIKKLPKKDKPKTKALAPAKVKPKKTKKAA